MINTRVNIYKREAEITIELITWNKNTHFKHDRIC